MTTAAQHLLPTPAIPLAGQLVRSECRLFIEQYWTKNLHDISDGPIERQHNFYWRYLGTDAVGLAAFIASVPPGLDERTTKWLGERVLDAARLLTFTWEFRRIADWSRDNKDSNLTGQERERGGAALKRDLGDLLNRVRVLSVDGETGVYQELRQRGPHDAQAAAAIRWWNQHLRWLAPNADPAGPFWKFARRLGTTTLPDERAVQDFRRYIPDHWKNVPGDPRRSDVERDLWKEWQLSAEARDGQPRVPQRRSLESVMADLDVLTGLSEVKQEVRSLANLIRLRKQREAARLANPQMSYHLVFAGNPGTGKTTVARLIAEIYTILGVIPGSNFAEAARQDLVAEYVGQTAIKTNEVIDRVLSEGGGVLFIDEAYTLTASDSASDFGPEAVATILKRMEDDRDRLVVIVAGYPELMDAFVRSNPGLESRFAKTIVFADYTPDELIRILQEMAISADYQLTDDAREKARLVLSAGAERRASTFANGRSVRRYFEQAIIRQADRVAVEQSVVPSAAPDTTQDRASLMQLHVVDMPDRLE